jgi:hypothetical protein
MHQGVSLQRNYEAGVSLAGPELQPVEGGIHGMGAWGRAISAIWTFLWWIAVTSGIFKPERSRMLVAVARERSQEPEI